MADEFLHAATQAPQPIQAEDKNASSASSFAIGILFASSASPVSTATYPPDEMMRSNAFLSTDKSLITGNEVIRTKKLEIKLNYDI